MSECIAPSLDEVRRQLADACEHLRECAMLYGDKRFERGVPADRDWAVFPLCRALNGLTAAVEGLEARVAALEGRPQAGPANWQALVAPSSATDD